jgi:hypothetical protein
VVVHDQQANLSRLYVRQPCAGRMGRSDRWH